MIIGGTSVVRCHEYHLKETNRSKEFQWLFDVHCARQFESWNLRQKLEQTMKCVFKVQIIVFLINKNCNS